MCRVCSVAHCWCVSCVFFFCLVILFFYDYSLWNTNRLTLGSIVVEKLTFAERQKKLKRFNDKRHRRNWSKKQTSYSSRKDFAEARPRVRGRFVSKDSADLSTEHSGAEQEDQLPLGADDALFPMQSTAATGGDAADESWWDALDTANRDSFDESSNRQHVAGSMGSFDSSGGAPPPPLPPGAGARDLSLGHSTSGGIM